MNAEERLREAEEVIARIANPHFKDKVSQAQELLRRNAELISQVEAKEQDDLHTESSQGTALMLQEINNNLVEFLRIYSELGVGEKQQS